MNETPGVVVRLEGPNVWVRAEGPGKACGACAQKDACPTAGGSGLLDKSTGQGQGFKLLRLPNTIHAKPGDAVVIRAAEGAVLRAVWGAYGVPLLLGLLGALIGKSWFADELFVFAGMLLGLAAGFLMLRWFGRKHDGDGNPVLSIDYERAR